uniref:Branched-chain amino acid transport system ATP-binding protein n=1 Tax=Candidatus Kentrum sp. MB TaxID=2138164 RepID=A0A450XUA5_9GAMM|nr:MAG: branched-chain amino acid transport system ATP-binding protein [Candidatus Kentron sp. MB]VFK35671.1 MAG: branched-chain amino acid transport system ATP-binding protein [Candidatus Kentron sp. MB]VFK77427.1 MAG: branched-chain amino acid transport system ATP-binding protein [Candidatus Kentron sp. MB]
MNSTTLLRAEGLKKALGGQVVFDALDLKLSQGEVALLRGENGSGKTTLLNVLTGNLESDAGTLHYLAGKTPRAYRFPRGWWQDVNPIDHFTPESVAREGVSRTWQDVRLFNAQTLRDNIAVSEQGHPGENPLMTLLVPLLSSRREKCINQAADAMLARLGLAGREQSSADMISLGQSKRVAIARSVAAGVRILFLDEPLAGLDRQGIQDVLRLLESLVKIC